MKEKKIFEDLKHFWLLLNADKITVFHILRTYNAERLYMLNKQNIFWSASEGLRSKALPNHEDYVLTAPCPNNRVPQPAPMAEVLAIIYFYPISKRSINRSPIFVIKCK